MGMAAFGVDPPASDKTAVAQGVADMAVVEIVPGVLDVVVPKRKQG